MSNWREDSELSRLNRHAGGTPFPLSPELYDVLRQSAEVSAASGGAFDVTVGPLVEAWGFGAGPGGAEPPGPEAIGALLDRVGYRKLVLDPEHGSASKEDPGLEVDLSAVAPGYAVDLVAARLEERGFGRYLVEIGGELRVSGTNPEGRAWRVAIERPELLRRETQRVVEISDAALATSGDYRDFFERDGVRYTHTIDPATGSPVLHSLASATVIDPSCALADAWATAMMVLGPEEGLRLADERGMPVLLLVYEGDGVREIESREFARRFGATHPAADRGGDSQGATPTPATA
jgi:thiamine biosynthesis lipoprotein